MELIEPTPRIVHWFGYQRYFERLAHLVLLQPFLQQLLAALLEDRPAELQRLKLIELALVQQDAKVLEQRGGLARLSWDALEATDGVRGSQDSLERTEDRKLDDATFK